LLGFWRNVLSRSLVIFFETDSTLDAFWMFKKGLKNNPIESSGLHRMDGKASVQSRRAMTGGEPLWVAPKTSRDICLGA